MSTFKLQIAEQFLSATIKGTEWDNKVYACGGYVRDQIIGTPSKDLDIVVDSHDGGLQFAIWFTKQIANYKEDSNPVLYPTYGTAKFNLNGITYNGHSLSGVEIESVMPRSEIYTYGSRKPEVAASSLKDDAERRDTTFNSLFKNISTGEILDLTGRGLSDLKNGVIRTPIHPDKTFKDDALRMLRIIRFYARYNYRVPLYIIRSIKKNAAELSNISAERIRDEFDKILITANPDKGIKFMRITGILSYVIPELNAAHKMQQNKYHKYDVFTHILDVVRKTDPSLKQRLMALYHDIGKTRTRSVTSTGTHFYDHEIVGSYMAADIMQRLKYPNELIKSVTLGVKLHMRLKSSGPVGDKISDKALRKFKFTVGEEMDDLLCVMHADNMAHADNHTVPHQIENLKRRLSALNLTGTTPKIPITGKDLIALGLPPSEHFRTILDLVKEEWYENPNITRDQAISIAIEYCDRVGLSK
jgi:putative nucleotidyltransferase with HDIG domain